MSLRKFMHPRNKYKQEPNFKQLAILYPEFRKIAVTDLAGKIRINFNDLESLRVLAKTLLKHDFNLSVEIPSAKLVPAIPSRLNYVLWIEDLVKHATLTDMSKICGIDIGTGAVCVYPLLFAKMYGCKMIGTEIDEESWESAMRNVKNNKLENLVEVIRVDKGNILGGFLPENNHYTFTMCNPPFFSNDQEASKILGNRKPPRNAPSGSKVELVVEGGETQFVSKMLEDSLILRDKIKIYTTMLGKKTSLMFLRKELEKQNIDNSTWTEFCQGRTTRWGLAWSFLSKDAIDLTTAPVIRTSGNAKTKQSAKRPPSEIVFPARNNVAGTEELVAILKSRMNMLKIRVEELDVVKPKSGCWGCQLMVDEDTWSHERRKRRMMANENSPSKKIRLDASSEDSNSTREPTSTDLSTDFNVQEIKGSFLLCNLIVGEIKDDEHSSDDDDTDDDKDEEKRLKISMSFEGGSGGRNAMETLRQYLINKLDLREVLRDNSSAKKSQKKQRARKKKKKSENT